ncbi:probable G-protein coupled receptor 139 [Scyliorhinus canicula]|uniref:probable G-protein coupled receptor 139 n=1 Tax=Scyliorhinus canicula TaxID=7830 RepID=UPI0018F3AB52|nr:probable G-protein coupled receptor 139 [Scyliorhinus canicula]
MAVADLLVVIFDIILLRINEYYFPNSFLFFTSVCSFHYVLIRAVTDISVWLTVAFTFDRFVAICFQTLKIRYCTETTAALCIGAICMLFLMKNVPWYFIFEPYTTIGNVSWGCQQKLEYYTLPAWVAFSWIDRSFTPLLPTFLILLLNALTVGHILMASRIRRRLRGSKNETNNNDQEMQNRRKSVILLFAISGNFILLWMTYVIFFLLIQFANHKYLTSFNSPVAIADYTSFMLLLLSCCTNTCIYAVTQSKFREDLKNLITFPLKRTCKLYKQIKHSWSSHH